MTEEIYNIGRKCGNCGKSNLIDNIPKGTRVEEFLREKNLKCRNCDCPIPP